MLKLDYMKVLKYEKTIETEIKKSRFITLNFILDNSSDIKQILDSIKSNYPKATHYCYAFKNVTSSSICDDGEPSGSAGLPIFNVIEKNNLDKTLIVVVRYFGGIKLGASNLFRAYLGCASQIVKENKIIDYLKKEEVELVFNYDKENKIKTFIKNENIKIKKEERLDKITLIIFKDEKTKLDDIAYLLDNIR